MAEANRRRWTRDESVTALSLYYQIPFGKMHAKNPVIRKEANRLERTASSLAMKLVNFASLDPEHQKRGVKGMGNVSTLDREVWQAYYGKWEALAQSKDGAIDFGENEGDEFETEAIATLRVRRGQSFFRRTVCAAYDGRCCITGISSRALLRASHIVPWSQNVAYRVDPRNGLALNALHDAAFDRGLITLDDKLRVVLSRYLLDEVPTPIYKCFFDRYAGKSITMPTRFVPAEAHLKYHRERLFLN